MERITHIKSVSVGFNINSQLAPYEMGLLSINDQNVRSAKLIDRVMRWDFTKNKDYILAIEPIVPVKKVCSNEENNVLQYSLCNAVNKLFTRATNGWPDEIKKHIQKTLAFLFEHLDDFVFILRVTRIHQKMISTGLPLCVPTYHRKEEKSFCAIDLYNPILAIKFYDENKVHKIIKNNLSFDDEGTVYILSGANNGGKTVFMSAVGIVQILSQLGMLIPASRLDISPVNHVFVHYPKYLSREVGRFEDECIRVKEIFKTLDEYSLCLFDETFSSTEAEEGSWLAFEMLKALSIIGVRTVFGTHLHSLFHMVDREVGEGKTLNIDYLCVETLEGKERTYKITRTLPEGNSYAQSIAVKYGISFETLIKMRFDE